jgi:hypothetical protein
LTTRILSDVLRDACSMEVEEDDVG